jgi:hypothetical protein
MNFDKDWFERVSVLTMGQQVTVLGKLAVVEAYVVVLAPCELIG